MKKILIGTLLVFGCEAYAVEKNNADEISDKTLAEKIISVEQQLKDLQQEFVLLSQQKLENSQQKMANANSLLLSQPIDKPWQIKSYGSLLYKSHEVFKNTQDLTPYRRDVADLERVVIEFAYQFEPQWSMELELEYEHGGTGATLEYDGFEEFGEFETEIEAGGEVLVEKLAVKYQLSSAIDLEFGRIFVPIGLGTELHKPNQYFTTQRYWSESTLLPQVWHETGINLQAKWQGLSAQALLTTGLNSEYFRTYQWIATGHQKRFEQVNADELAITLRLDYGDIKNGTGIGVSFYNGNTTGNRNKINKIHHDGNLSIVSINGAFRSQNWLVKGQYIYGKLDDSLAITQANKTTPGLQPGNFAQLGSEAESFMLEAAYNSQLLLGLAKPFYIFSTYQYANPIKKVQQGRATQRFDREEISVGINYFPTKNLVLKAQVSEQGFAQSNLDNTTSLSLSMGYQFSI
ncbi:hypothetical protein AADZ91_14240 [Colwelliaceae bacterium 6441]